MGSDTCAAERSTVMEIQLINNQIPSLANEDDEDLFPFFTAKATRGVLDYHQSLPGYEATPLVHLTNLASLLGVESILVKDESKRFKLNAFKVLGSSYGLARHILGDACPISFDAAVREGLMESTLVSATDGNHGFGLAYVAKIYNLKSKIYMPKGTVPERAERIRRLGAEVVVTEHIYDKCVELAKEFAQTTNGLFVQDTAVETDTADERKIPLYIMQGYTTMLQEIYAECPDLRLSHVFLQCGVGSFAGALAAYLTNELSDPPKIIAVESNKADCFFASAELGTGESKMITGEMDSIMAGLCCGVVSVQAWPILRKTASHFVSCDDSVTRRGMRILANPYKTDKKIISGESGAVTTGLLYTLVTDPSYTKFKEEIGLDSDSRILLISTEGDTDPEGYYTNIWG